MIVCILMIVSNAIFNTSLKDSYLVMHLCSKTPTLEIFFRYSVNEALSMLEDHTPHYSPADIYLLPRFHALG